ncbi:MAG: hypothetical protein ACLFSQ_12115, partial [Candidatus Zixiibacteriota bacterium]
MKKGTILGLIIMVMAIALMAEVPHQISYQGKIYETTTGEAVSDSEYNIRFRIYTEETGGEPIWEEIHYDVVVTNGLYHVMLGSSEPFGEHIDFSEQYYLEILFDGSLMEPRYRFGSSPYALNISGMGAEDGDIMKYNALLSKWETVTPFGEEQVELFLERNPVSLNAFTTIEGIPLNNWDYISGIPVDIADGDSFLTEEAVENYITNGPIDLHNTATFDGGKINDWRYLTNVPDGLSDGDQWSISTEIGDGTADSSIVLGGNWGIFRKGNNGIGNGCSTHVNLGQISTTGKEGADYKHITVSGGYHNIAENQGATIAGGGENRAAGAAAFIGGGSDNIVGGHVSVNVGGLENIVNGDYSAAIGGARNIVDGNFSMAFGREAESMSDYLAQFYSPEYPGTLQVAGIVKADSFVGLPDFIVDGDQTGFNQMRVEDQPWLEDQITFVGGDGIALNQGNDTIIVDYDGQIGDFDWEIEDYLGDGEHDTTLILGGKWGIARVSNYAFGNACSTFINFGQNSVTGRDGSNHKYITVSGGRLNIAENTGSVISGGTDNTASGQYGAISGGYSNSALGDFSSVSGGKVNTVSGICSYIPNGYAVNVNGNFAMGFGRQVTNNSDYTAKFFSSSYPGSLKVVGVIHADSYSGLPADLADGDDYLSEHDVETYITNGALDLHSSTTIGGNPINDWESLTSIPVDIADGDDVDTTIAEWTAIKGIPAGFDDGIDDVDTVMAEWASIKGTPIGLDDGDDVDTTIADWGYIKNIPADIADGDDDTQLSEAQVETYITNDAIDLADGSTYNGSAINDFTTLANVPADLADGDDVDTTIAEWTSLKNIPADIADGDDDTQLSE